MIQNPIAKVKVSSSDLDTWRCTRCGRILAKLVLAAGSVVEVKCSSCNAVNLLCVVAEPSRVAEHQQLVPLSGL